MGRTKYKPAHIMLSKLFISLFLAVSVQSFIIPNSEASSFLSRKRRANGIAEEMLPSNINRECQKEQCDFEEYVEAKENETKKQGIKLREVIKANFDIENKFTEIYTKCYDAVKSDDRLFAEDGYNMKGKCLTVLDEYFNQNDVFSQIGGGSYDYGNDDNNNDDSYSYENNYNQDY